MRPPWRLGPPPVKPGTLALIVLATIVYVWCAVQVVDTIRWLTHPLANVWLYDWNVYHAGAEDLVNRSLYRVPLVEPGFELPVPTLSIGPFSAVWVLPLLPLGREVGGIAFIVINLASVVAGLILSAKALWLRYPWAWAAVISAVYLALWPYVAPQLGLADNNDLVFLLVAGFAAAHVAGRDRIAGVILGLAIATKVWPIALVVLLLRERHWTTIRWAAWIVVVQGILILAWLGPDVLPALIRSVFFANGPRDLENIPVLWTSYFRVAWDWWPAWGTYAVAIALLAIPARGQIGLGLGIIAGLSLNANLWFHYLWSFALGLALVAAGVVTFVVGRRGWQRIVLDRLPEFLRRSPVSVGGTRPRT